MKLESAKTFTNIVSGLVGVAAILSGGLFALNEYLDSKDKVRIEHTLTFMTRWQSAPLYEAQQRINGAWLDAFPELKGILTVQDTPARITDACDEFVLRTIKTKSLEGDLAVIVDFFQGLSICAQRAICDESSVRAFFGSYARRFFRLHFAYITQIRQERNDPSFALDLETFASGAPSTTDHCLMGSFHCLMGSLLDFVPRPIK